MGSRGASSGIADNGKEYGTEFSKVYQQGNIKFVVKNSGSNAAPMETMTSGRIYATVDKNTEEVKYITYYDKNNKRLKQIDLGHEHTINGEKVSLHTHIGYNHNEKGDRKPSEKEKKMIDRVMKVWQYHKRR